MAPSPYSRGFLHGSLAGGCVVAVTFLLLRLLQEALGWR
jgi:hypothetical protein